MWCERSSVPFRPLVYESDAFRGPDPDDTDAILREMYRDYVPPPELTPDNFDLEEMRRQHPWSRATPALGSHTPHKRGHHFPKVQEIAECLSRWLDAMNDGSAVNIHPSPYYTRRGGKPQWTEEELDTVLKAIDARMWGEFRRWGYLYADRNCDYSDLAVPQRLALVQELDAILSKYPNS